MSLEKRQHILNTAMCMFNEGGFHSTPTSKIAKKAKVSVGTLFNYFSTKEELIEAIYVQIKLHSKTRFLELIEEKGSDKETLMSMWSAIIVWGVENPEEFKYLELFCHSPLKNTYSSEKSLEAYKRFQLQILRATTPTTMSHDYPEYVLTYIDNSIHAATRYLLKHPNENRESFIPSAFDLLWNGLSSQKI
jgi:AcrR family transcriptional regulator